MSILAKLKQGALMSRLIHVLLVFTLYNKTVNNSQLHSVKSAM
jgi:hypothetical protein